MIDRAAADIICRALLAIVAILRKKFGLPEYHDITITITDK
jgi:hypothetical protein